MKMSSEQGSNEPSSNEVTPKIPTNPLALRSPGGHRELLQAVWGPDYGDQVDYLRVFVNQLRKKIEAKPSSPTYLLTEPWVGYRFHLQSETR